LGWFPIPAGILVYLILCIKLIHFTYRIRLLYLFVPEDHAFITQEPRIHLIHLQRHQVRPGGFAGSRAFSPSACPPVSNAFPHPPRRSAVGPNMVVSFRDSVLPAAWPPVHTTLAPVRSRLSGPIPCLPVRGRASSRCPGPWACVPARRPGAQWLIAPGTARCSSPPLCRWPRALACFCFRVRLEINSRPDSGRGIPQGGISLTRRGQMG